MKLLLLSDLHLDTQFAWARREVARRRREALRTTLGCAAQLARDEAVDIVLIGGDLYEQERFSPDTGEFLRRTFEQLHPTPIYVSPGNHDWYAPSSLYRQVSWSPNVRVFTSDRLESVELRDGLTLWGAAHRAPANTDGFLSGFRVDRGGIHLALFHGSELGELAFQPQGKVPHGPFREEEIERAGIHHAFLGHFHQPKDTTRFTYPGNPDPLSFGEDGQRAVVLATVLGDGSVSRERRRVATTEVHDLEVDVSGCESRQEVRDRLAERITGRAGCVRVTLVGELGAAVDLRLEDLAELGGAGAKRNGTTPTALDDLAIRVGRIRPRYDLESIGEERTVRGQFVRDVRGSDLPEERKLRVIATGLRALEGRQDLEVL